MAGKKATWPKCACKVQRTSSHRCQLNIYLRLVRGPLPLYLGGSLTVGTTLSVIVYLFACRTLLLVKEGGYLHLRAVLTELPWPKTKSHKLKWAASTGDDIRRRKSLDPLGNSFGDLNADRTFI